MLTDDLPLRVDPYQVELFPAPVYYFSNAEIELAAHDDGVRFAGELVKMIQTDAVDLVVYIEAEVGQWQASRWCLE